MIEIDGVKYEKVYASQDEENGCLECVADAGDTLCSQFPAGCSIHNYVYKRIKEEVMFKKGDRVVCVDVCADASFTVGKAYIIDRINSNAAHGGLIFAIDDCGNLQGMYAKRFKAPQYTTRPIDYTGCDPVIAEHLQRGESILCEVCNDGHKAPVKTAHIICFSAGINYPYEDKTSAWNSAKPIPRKRTETRVKKASEIVAWLEDNGYEVDNYGDWISAQSADFITTMFKFCGETKPENEWVWKPEWLEEVVID